MTPRIGVVWNNFLVYGKGGLAAGEADVSVLRLTGGSAGQFFNNKQARVGWTAGGGVDFALTRNWIFGVEYNYVDLGSQHYGGATTAPGGGLGSDQVNEHLKLRFSEVLGRLSYKFDGGDPIGKGPVVAGDMSARPVYKAASMVAALPAWTGIYFGINGGWGWGTAQHGGQCNCQPVIPRRFVGWLSRGFI